MRRAFYPLVLLVLVGLAGSCLLPTGGAAATLTDPGCPAGTVRYVSHSWWQEKGEAFPGRHIHVGGCIPSHRTLTGTVLPLDLDVTLHGDPGTVGVVRAAWESSVVTSKTVNRRCSTDCTFSVHLDVPFGGRTGWRELRLTANISSNVFGERQYQSTRYPMCLQTCSGGYSTHRTGMAGWYHDNYQNVYIDEASAKKIEAGPINGMTFQAKGDGHRLKVAIDADSHAGNPGLVLTCIANCTSTSWRTYAIPAGLPSGWHALFIRAERDFIDGMSAGQGEFWFRVP